MHEEEDEKEDLQEIYDYSDLIIEEEPFIAIDKFSKLEDLSKLDNSNKSD